MPVHLNLEDLPHYNYSDYQRWEGAWELIYGIPYAMSPSPIYKHQRVSLLIANQLEYLLIQCEYCKSVIAIDWIVSEDTVVQPDNLVISDSVTTDFIKTAPTLIFEILSPSTAAKDKNLKFKLYESQQVKYYILVDIEMMQVDIYQLQNESYQKLVQTHDETIAFDLVKCQIEFDFNRIWSI